MIDSLAEQVPGPVMMYTLVRPSVGNGWLAVPGPAMSVVANFLGLEPNKVAPVLILTFINIHHYFTDGVAWKLGNPEVRKDLFSHVNPATVPLPAGPANPTGGKQKRRPVDRT